MCFMYGNAQMTSDLLRGLDRNFMNRKIFTMSYFTSDLWWYQHEFKNISKNYLEELVWKGFMTWNLVLLH